MVQAKKVRVVEATGTATASDSDLAQRIEAAMVQAIRQCLDQGITDPDTTRERMLAARDAVLAE